MLEWLKTPSGAYNLTLIVAVIAWLIAGIGIFAGFHLNKVRTIEAEAKPEYAEVATWNYKGAQSISKDYSLPGPLSGWADRYVRDTPNGKQVRSDDEAISHFEATLKKYPKYPFSYYFLAEAFRLKGDNEVARTYAKQGIDILQITTKIPNHSPDHDDALKNLDHLLSGGNR